MSELKPITVTDECGSYRVYNKSDVDAAIDELKAAHHKERHEYIKMIAELKQKLEDAKATAYAESVDAGMENRRLKQELRHHKCKRCLAMAMWCRSRACFYDTMRENNLYWGMKSDRAYKWHKRWLKIAEQFKEAK